MSFLLPVSLAPRSSAYVCIAQYWLRQERGWGNSTGRLTASCCLFDTGQYRSVRYCRKRYFVKICNERNSTNRNNAIPGYFMTTLILHPKPEPSFCANKGSVSSVWILTVIYKSAACLDLWFLIGLYLSGSDSSSETKLKEAYSSISCSRREHSCWENCKSCDGYKHSEYVSSCSSCSPTVQSVRCVE